MKRKILIFVGLLLFILFSATVPYTVISQSKHINTAFAAKKAELEIDDYPSVPGVTAPEKNCTGPDCLGRFISYWIGLGIYLAGAISLISFTIGAIGLIISADSPEASSNAKSRMKGAVLGLALTLSSIMILNTINTQIATITITTVPGVLGVFYTAGDGKTPAPSSEFNRDVNAPTGATEIIYKCNGLVGLPALLIWNYPETNFKGSDGIVAGVTVARIPCGGKSAVGKSFKMGVEKAGVYYCLDGCSGKMCNGYMSNVVNNSEDDIGPIFRSKIKGVRIVNASGRPASGVDLLKTSDYFGVIFHTSQPASSGGGCMEPIINTATASGDEDTAKCESVTITAQSATIFSFNKNNSVVAGVSSGDGVNFYSEPHGWDAGILGGFYNVENKNTTSTSGFNKRAKEICFLYDGIDVPNSQKKKCYSASCGNKDQPCSDSYPCIRGYNCVDGFCVDPHPAPSTTPKGECSAGACENFGDKGCAGSILIKGNYLVALYSGGPGTGEINSPPPSPLQCQVFTKSVPNMQATPFIAPGTQVGTIRIIPLK